MNVDQPLSTRIEGLANAKGYYARRASPGGLWLLSSHEGAVAHDRRGSAVFTTFAAIEFLRSLPKRS